MPLTSAFNRRLFLKQLGVGSLGALAAPTILADPYAPISLPFLTSEPVRIRGRVVSAGRGLRGVCITDGVSVAATGEDGRYELIGDRQRPFAYISVPTGFAIPMSEKGTAALHQPLPTSGSEVTIDWSLRPLSDSDTNHSFLLLADPQTLDADDMKRFQTETLPDIQSTVHTSSHSTMFSIACGDIMFDNLSLFPDYERVAQQTGLPCFQVLGNHDVERLAKTDEDSVATFVRHFGPTYYSFNRGEVHYVVLDDVFWLGDGYLGYLTKNQLDWLQADLSFVEKGRTVIAFMHIPPYCTQHLREGLKRPDRSVVVSNRELLYRLLEPYRAQIVVGHMHETEHTTDGGVPIYVCGAVCGAWWTGDICGDGTPNGYGVFEVSGSDVRWKYKATGRNSDHQLRIYPRGADPAYPDEIVINIWDWDEGWKVSLYEDGMKKGPIAPRRGRDPLSVSNQEGPDKPTKHPWAEPYTTDHLFYAPVIPGTRKVLVEASDRWGRISTQELLLQ